MVDICIWCALFVTSQFDVIFMFPSGADTVGMHRPPPDLKSGLFY